MRHNTARLACQQAHAVWQCSENEQLPYNCSVNNDTASRLCVSDKGMQHASKQSCLEFSHGFLDWDVGVHAVHVVQVNVVCVQSLQRGEACFPARYAYSQLENLPPTTITIIMIIYSDNNNNNNETWQACCQAVASPLSSMHCINSASSNGDADKEHAYEEVTRPDIFTAAITGHAPLLCELDPKLGAQLNM